MSSTDASACARRWGRVLIGIFLAVTMLRVWMGPVTTPTAQAQIPNAGSQRSQLLQETQRTNDLLKQILATLRERTLKVQIEGTDNTSTGGVRPGKVRSR